MTSSREQQTSLFYFVLSTQTLINAATFISIPLLALYLTKDLGYTPYTMGAILTTLLVSTRVAPVFTGALADRYGHKKFVISGLFVRFLGFILIGYNSEALIFTGVFLIGIGGSQYESGTYGYLAKVNKVRSDAFYLNNQALNLGVIIGPLIAFFIPHQGYGSFFLSSALAFLTLAIINSFAFPADDKHSHIQTKLSLGSLLTDFYTDKKFLIFNIACIPWWFLFSQLYVLLPLAFSKKTSSEGDELIIYLVNGLVRISLTLLLLRRIKGFSPLALAVAGAECNTVIELKPEHHAA